MSTPATYTAESILESLGYPDPMTAARQQARMILLGRLAHYQTAVRQLEKKWGVALEQMRQKYEQEGKEDFETDDDYLQWQWCADAIQTIQAQLDALQ
jgi:hypothetical protein